MMGAWCFLRLTNIIRMSICVLSLVVLCSVSEGFKFEPINLNTTFRFDGLNHFRLQKIEGGKYKLHIMRDGKALATDLNLEEADSRAGGIVAVRYVDKDRIWIVRRMERMMEKAWLINLAEERVEAIYAGIGMKFSQDGRHLLYEYPAKWFWLEAGVFMDGLMLYPRVEPLTGLGNLDSAENNSHINELMGAWPKSALTEGPAQTGQDEISFIVSLHQKEPDFQKTLRYPMAMERYAIRGLMGKSNGLQLTIRKSMLDLDRLRKASSDEKLYPPFPESLASSALSRIQDFETSVTLERLSIRMPKPPGTLLKIVPE